MSKNNISILIEKDYRNFIHQGRLKFTAKTALNYFDLNDVEISISIISDSRIRELNREFRSIKSATDVLSFSANEINPETGKEYLGDVVISYPIAEKQSKTARQSIFDEIDLLTIHGILHLLGYDHESKEEEERMITIQTRIVQKIKESSMDIYE